MATHSSLQLRPLSLPVRRTAAFVRSTSLSLSTKLSYPLKPNYSASVPHMPSQLKIVCARSSKDVRFRPGEPDPVYRNRLVGMLVTRSMRGGKKSLAYRIIYLALSKIRAKMASSGDAANPLLVLRDALREVTPDVKVKPRRVGGTTHQVPVEVASQQGRALAIRWLLNAARKRSGKSMISKLSDEIMDAAKGTGEAVRMKEAMHKTAEANRAFAHIR